MQAQGRYTILGEIASGGTATVFLAEDSVLRRKVALKKLHPHLLNHPEMVKRFEKEAVAVASLSHENVIKVYDFGTEDKGLYLAMEYVDGVSLDGLLATVPKGMPNLAALSVFHQLLEGLAAAHACGIFHRDIKPSNILVDWKGCVRIADFGIAFFSEETSITKTGSYLGTPGYSSPEQALGRAVTAKTDIFASGSLFHRALTGKMPFEADTPHAVLVAIMDKTPLKATLVNRRIIPELAELIQDMLAKDPDRRPSAAECARRVEVLAEKLGSGLDPARTRRLMEAPARSIERECRDVASHYAQAARLATGQGRMREAMKLFSQAEIFSESGSEISLEARFLSDRMARDRMRKAILVALALLCSIFGGTYVISRLLPEKTRTGTEAKSVIAAPRKVPPATVPVQPDTAPSLREAPAPRRLEPAAALPVSAAGSQRAKGKPRAAATTAAEAPKGSLQEAAAKDAGGEIAIAFGSLYVKTNPPFVKIYVDGHEIGTTPLASPINMKTGSHRMELERTKCKTLRTAFMIMKGETTSLRFTLDRAETGP